MLSLLHNEFMFIREKMNEWYAVDLRLIGSLIKIRGSMIARNVRNYISDRNWMKVTYSLSVSNQRV